MLLALLFVTTMRVLCVDDRLIHSGRPRSDIARWNGLATHLHYTECDQMLSVINHAHKVARQVQLSHQSLPDRKSNSRSPSGHIQLHKNIAQVAINRSGADDQRLGNLAVGMSFGDQAQHI